MTNLQAVAEQDGYETVEEFLSDKAWEIRNDLAEAGVNTFNISTSDISSLIVDQDGDVDSVIQGYLVD
jgi:hypothetical protein